MPDLSIGYDTAGAPEALQRGFIKPSEAAKRAALDLERGIGRTSKAVRESGRAAQDAGAKAERYTRTQRLVAQIMRETGASHAIAARAVRTFGTDLDRAEREAAQYARQMDRAEKEVRQLAAAQRAAAGTSLTTAMKQQAAATSRLASGTRLLASQFGYLAGAAGVIALAHGIRSVVDAYQAQAKAEAQVAARLASTGNAIGFTVEQLKAYAAAIQRETGISDEAILEQQGVLLSFTHITRDNFDRATRAAIDMSMALGTDLRSNVVQLGKALDDPIRGMTALSRSGTTFDDAFKKVVRGLVDTGQTAKAQAMILAEVERQYGKTAAAIRAAEGPTKALGAEFGDFKEKLGKVLFESGGIRDFEETLLEMFRNLNKPGALDGLKATVEGARDVIAALAKVIGFAVENWQLFTAAVVAIQWPPIVAGVESLTAAMMANPIIAAGAAVAVAIGLVNQALKAWARDSGQAIAELSAESNELMDAWNAIGKEIATGDTAAMEARLQHLTNEWVRVSEATDNARAELDRLSRTEGVSAETLNRYRAEVQGGKNALAQLEEMMAKVTDALNAQGTAIKKVIPLTAAQQTALEKMLAKLREVTAGALADAKATLALADAQDQGTRAVSELQDEMKIQAKLLDITIKAQEKGIASTEAFRAALGRYEQALRDAVEAERYLAGKETLARLKDQIAVEQALLAITSAGPAAVDALSKAIQREQQIIEAQAKASKRQAAEIETSMRRLFALQDARAVASQIQAIRQELVETRRLAAARAQGTAAAVEEAAQIQLETDLRTAAAGGINLQTLALMALIQARAQETAQSRQSDAFQNLKDEIELLRLRNRVMLEGLRSGLSQGEAQRQGDMAAQVERMSRETGLAREVIGEFVEEQAALNDEFERTVGRLEYAGAVLDRIAGIMSQMGGTLGDLGSALGGVAQGFSDIQAGAAEGGAMGALGAIAGALKMARAISGLYISLGFAQGQRGTGALGGQLSGDFADLGSQIGGVAGLAFGPIGSAIGSLAGSIIGGAIKQGADEFLATILSFGTDLVATVDKVEGGLGPAGDALTSGITDVLSKLEAAIGGEVFVAGVQLKIRDDVVKVFVNGITGAFEGDTAIQDAITFAVSEMLKTAEFGAGISETMQAILRNGFESLDQLEAAVNFGNQLDDLLADPLARFMNAMNRQARELAATATQLGVPLGTVVAAMEAQAQAALDVSRSAVLAAAGLDPAVEGFRTLMAQIDQTSEESVAALEDQLRQVAEAALGSAEALRTGGSAFDGTAASFDSLMLEMGVSGDRADRLRERFEELTAAGVPAEEIVQELTVALEGLDSSTARQAIERFRAQFLGGLFDQMATLARQAGNNRLANEYAARAEEFRFQAMLISARVTIAAAQAEGLLGEARAAALLAQLDNLAALRAALQAAGVRGGGRGRGTAPTAPTAPTITDADREAEEAARRSADAARAFAETLADLESRTAGVTDTARAYADEQARLLALYRDGSVPLADYARALEIMAQLHLEDIAADWAGAAQSMRQTDLQAAALALRDRAQQAWEDALLAAADNPAAYERAAQAIIEGLEAQLHEIGRDALGALGSEFVRLRREGVATTREIRYLARNLDAFGLTGAQLRRVVSEGILPGLLDMAIAEAERVGDTERAIALRQQQADIERRLQLLQLSLWQAQLEAAGALDAATRAIIDQLVIDLGRVSAGPPPPPGDEGPLRPRFPDARLLRGGGEGGAGPAESVADTLADLERSLRFDLASPAEQAAIRFQELRDRIMAAVGTEEERYRVLMLAEEQYNRERLRGLMDLRDQILGAQSQDQPAARAIEQARAAFGAAVASGDEEAILEAAQRWLDAAADFPTLLRSAQAAILAGLGPVFASGAPSLAPPTPTPQLAGLSALPPPISFPGAPAGQAPDLSRLESRIDALTREVTALRAPMSRTATATEATATGVRPLRDLAPVLERTL